MPIKKAFHFYSSKRIVLRFEYNDEKHVSDIALRLEYNDEKHVSESSNIRI